MLFAPDTHAPLSFGEAAGLLRGLPDLYPDATAWLEHAVGEVAVGQAEAAQYRNDSGVLLGLALGVWKPGKGYKVRTLFVEPRVRNHGVGSALLTALLASPRARFAGRAYITVDEELLPGLLPLLSRQGFAVEAVRPELYAAGRREVVLGRADSR